MPVGPLTNFPNGVNAGGMEIAGDALTATAYSMTAAGVLAGVRLSGLKLVTQELTATGTVNATTRVVFLNHAATIIAATLAAPVAGDILIVVNTSATGTIAHTVTLPSGVTWNGTHLIATLDAVDDALICIASSATRYRVLVNVGAVAFT